MTFQTLHQALVDRDTMIIRDICEGDLAASIAEFFDACDDDRQTLVDEAQSGEDEDIKL